MDDRARAERALEIKRRLAAGEHPTSIFPKKLWVPPAEVEVTPDGRADFLAADVQPMTDGTRLRSYVYTCDHGTTTLTLPDRDPDKDHEVLVWMVNGMRSHVADTGNECRCQPGSHTAPAKGPIQ